MTKNSKVTLHEIISQPEVWADTIKAFQVKIPAIDAFYAQNKIDQVIFIGCGSTYYLSQSAAMIFQTLNKIPAKALPSSELSLFEKHYLNSGRHTLLVAVSRSGETTETIRAMQLFNAGNYGKTIAITTYPESSMTKYADLCLVVESAQEKSIAQTRSFTSMLLMAEAVSLHISGQNACKVMGEFPQIVRRLINHYQDLAMVYGKDTDINRFFFLGSAYAYGIASEAMLKMKEMSLSNSEAFHTLEFRHGPKSMVDANTLIVGLVNESSAYQEISVLMEMKALGSKVLSIVEESNPKLAAIGDVIELKSAAPETVRVLLFLPILQLIAYYRAIANGQDPDNPNNLDAVVHIPSMI